MQHGRGWSSAAWSRPTARCACPAERPMGWPGPLPRGLHCRMRTQGTRAGPRSSVTRVPRSEEHTSELQSLMRISYAVFCLKKKKLTTIQIQLVTHSYDL